MKTLILTFYTTGAISADTAASIANNLNSTISHYEKHFISIIISANNDTVKKAFKEAQDNELTVIIKH